MLVVLLVALDISAFAASPAVATLRGQAAPTQQEAVSSASWSAVSTVAAAPPYGTGPLTLSFAKAKGNTVDDPDYFDVVNTGALALQQASYTFSTTSAATTVIEACSGTWNTSTNACTGGSITTLSSTSTSDSFTSSTVPAAPGTSVQLRVRPTTAVKSASTVTIGVSVTRAQARAATTSNS